MTIESAKEWIRKHFQVRDAKHTKGLIDQWRSENVYPFESEPVTPIEKAERQLFDIVVLHVNKYLPAFKNLDTTNKRLQMCLIRNAIGNTPDELESILDETLQLPSEKIGVITNLLNRTKLTDMIRASKIVADRLACLKRIKYILLDSRNGIDLRIQNNLHRILAKNTWIFGEQYQLSVEDKPLNDVIGKYAEASGHVVSFEHAATNADANQEILDYLFARKFKLVGGSRLEHLIVELKKPGTILDRETVTQFEEFAINVASDERFESIPANWVFWIVSNEHDRFAQMKLNQFKDSPGLLYRLRAPSMEIWMKTEKQLLDDCNTKLQFYSEYLKYGPDQLNAIQYLSEVHGQYHSELISKIDSNGEPESLN